ncbi:MAG: hypothetical protein COA43_04135 [Robiginitomaculum sp.]|nr:MAG: hypothetical protein COA43_04135 [Robiginitomaculum sp.]
MSGNKLGFGQRTIKKPTPNMPVSRLSSTPKCYLQRRLEPMRMTQFKPVRLIYNNGYSSLDAILRNLSENGARIETPDAVHLPGKFIMKTTDGRLEKTCTRVWRDQNFIGVKFTP